MTAAIREERKQRAELAGGSILMRHVPLNLTAAQKADLRHYQPGQLLAFHRPVKAIAKNETVEVIRLETSGIAVRTASGEERRITAKQAKSFDLVEARPIEVLAGDRLLLMANRGEPDLRFTNGEIVTVSSVDSQGRVKLEDGRTIPANYRNFAHGYAITAHLLALTQNRLPTPLQQPILYPLHRWRRKLLFRRPSPTRASLPRTFMTPPKQAIGSWQRKSSKLWTTPSRKPAHKQLPR